MTFNLVLINKSRMKQTIAAFLVVLAPFVAVAEDAPPKDSTVWGTFGGWHVFMDPTRGNACYVARIYGEGVVMRFGRFRQKDGSGLYLSVNNPRWKSLKDDERYALEVQLGDYGIWKTNASATVEDDFNRSLLIATDNEMFLEHFQTSDTATLFYDGRQIANLSLRGVAKAIAEMNACQKKTDEILKARKPKSQKADPFAKDPSVEPSDDPQKL
ncbi:hypothetical protein [Agrobacterium cavarae]|uniref:hypothetical protein n=1 Tax=Agrobacterium cavarae TaxID=2528239 RepID=UPI0028AB552A|nr:hypothetical protein [Agrobacterium cavarae]